LLMAQASEKSWQKDTKAAAQDSERIDDSSLMRRISLFISHYPWIVCLLLVGVALVLDLHDLGKPSIWFDEAFSVELARQPLPLLWRTIFGPEPNMELYYLLLHFWLRLTALVGLHPVEWVVRLPSALCAALSTGVIFWLGRRYLGTIIAALAALLYACNYLQLIYAQQTRAYALQLLLISLAWLALLSALQNIRGQKRWWCVYVLMTVLAVYAHLFSLLILFSQCVAVSGLFVLSPQWRARIRRRVLVFVSSLVLIGILSIPMFIESLRGAKTGWLPVPHVQELLSLLTILSGDNTRYLLVMGISLLCGVLLIGFAVLIQRVSGLSRWVSRYPWISHDAESLYALWPFVWIMLCWLILPVVLSYLISQGSLRLFSTRYLVVIVPPFCLLVALCVLVFRRNLVRIILSCVLLGSAILVVPHYYQNAQVEDWNTAVHWMLARYQPGDGLVCYDNTVTQGCQIAVEYYLDAYSQGAHFSTDTPGAFSWEKYSYNAPQENPELALQPAALTTFAHQHTRLFMITGRISNSAGVANVKKTQQWLDQHYHFDAQTITSTVVIRLYTTH
jgi:mannosyltransferase